MTQRWRAIVGVLGLVGLVVAVVTSADDVREQALPSASALVIALTLEFVAVVFVAKGWIALFAADVDRAALARGMYTSQLTKYLPAGGFVQAASQVALSSQNGMASAAVRLPIFSLCAVVAAATVGSGLAVDSDLPGWARALAALGLLLNVMLDQRIMRAALRLARKLIRRVPDDISLPSQRAVFRCYGAMMVDIVAYSAAYAVLLGDLSDVRLWVAGAAFSAGWWVGYLVLPLPSGLGVREAVLIAALPGLATSSLLAASVAHRLLSFIAEATLAFAAHARVHLLRRTERPAADGPTEGDRSHKLADFGQASRATGEGD